MTFSPFPRVFLLVLLLAVPWLLIVGLLALVLAQPLPYAVPLMWDAPAPAAAPLVGYKVSRLSTARLAGAVVCTVPATVRACTDQVTQPGTYTYAVVADYGTAGISARSNEVVVTVQSMARPLAPTVLHFTVPASGLPAPPGPYPLWPRARLTIEAVDSEELVGENGAATNAIDGKLPTFWHTQWYGRIALLPHTLILDLGALCWVDGLVYTPRQGGEQNGTIVGYTVAVSMDAVTWVTVVPAGTWAADLTVKTVRFVATQGEYVRLTATAEIHGQAYTSAAEVGVFATGPPARRKGR